MLHNLVSTPNSRKDKIFISINSQLSYIIKKLNFFFLQLQVFLQGHFKKF